MATGLPGKSRAVTEWVLGVALKGALSSRLSNCAGWYSRVRTLVWVFRNKLCTSRVPNHWGRNILLGESGTVVPLLTSAASAPWRPSHAGAGNASHNVVPNTAEFGGCPPHRMWEMPRRAGGLQITRCYPSAVRSMSRHFAIRSVSLFVQCANGNGM